MKPHEETWRAAGGSVWRADDRIARTKVDGQSEADAMARATLIAKAPEMARMLLGREWVGDPYPYCDSCKVNSLHTHREDCAWLALMKAIGAPVIACTACSRPALLELRADGRVLSACPVHLRRIYETPEAWPIELRPLAGPTDAPRAIVTSVRVASHGGIHESVTFWNRGAYAGAVVVQGGDGLTIAARLLGAVTPAV